MLVLINAVKAITRSKGRNLLILLIVAAIAGASSVALAIRHAAASAEATGLAQLTITGTIQVDRQALMQTVQPGTGDPTTTMTNIRDILNKYPALTLDQLKTYAASPFVAELRYSGSLSVNAGGDLAPVSTTATGTPSAAPSTGAAQGGRGGGIVFNGNGPQIFDGRSLGNLTLMGYGTESAMTGFTSGQQQITAGAMIDLTLPDNACLVSDDFATFNSLSVGDTITVTNPAATTETYSLVIAGVYHNATAGTTTVVDRGPMFSTSQDPANQVLVSYPSLANIVSQSAAVATTTTDAQGNSVSTALSSTVDGTYVFASAADYDAFAAALPGLGLDPAYSLNSADLTQYQASLVPLQNLAQFAQTLLWIVLGVGAVVLVAIAIFSIRERKYEVGVLTAIGIAKPKVALQFVAEMFIVTVLGLIVGLGIGAVAAVPVANNLLSAQVAQQQAQMASVNQSFGRFGGGGMAGGPVVQVGPGGFIGRTVTYLSSINATVDWAVVGQLAAIGLGLAIVASAAGVIFALRYEPLTILANRT